MPCKAAGRRKNKNNDGGGAAAASEMEDERPCSLVLLNLNVRSNSLTTHGLLAG